MKDSLPAGKAARGLKNPVAKNILSALAIAFFGFILLNLTFLFDFLFQSLVRRLFMLFLPIDNPEMSYNWWPPMMQGLFLIVIGLTTWLVFRSKLSVLYKAIFLTVPTAAVLATIGIILFHWPVAVYSLGGLLIIAVLYYFYRSRQPWLYYYSVILIGLALAIFTLAGGEI